MDYEELDKRVSLLEYKEAESRRWQMETSAKLDEIHTAVTTILSRAVCPDPGACIRVNEGLRKISDEVESLKADKVLMVGGYKAIAVLCGFIVATIGVVGAVVAMFRHKL